MGIYTLIGPPAPTDLPGEPSGQFMHVLMLGLSGLFFPTDLALSRFEFLRRELL